MDNDLQILKEIQEWDKQIYALKDTLEEIPREAAEINRSAEEAKAGLKQVEQELKQIQLKQKEKEGELATKEGNVKKLQGQLAQVKTNKEYSALQSEIDSLKADNSLLEETIIKLLDQAEEVQTKFRSQKQSVELKEAECKKQIQVLDEKSQSFHKEIEALTAKRREKIKSVKPEIATLYDRIVEKKRGLAFVKIEGEVCGACQMRLRPQIQNEVMAGEKVVVCESCSRILYVE
jgi:hypothetical protein